MLRKLTTTDNSAAVTVIRVVLGIVLFAHGAQKMLGWFGGRGFTGTMGFMTGMLHIPALFAFLAIAAEFFGGLGLILGLFTRVAALGIAVNMLVAVFLVHIQYGFFANWSGTQKGEGIEYHLLVLAMATFLMIEGGGSCFNRPETGAMISAPKLWLVLARCHRSLALLVERNIADLGLCVSDFMVLEALLHKGPLTISEIQAKVLLASGSMTAAVDRVEALGLVVRKTTSKDRRARVLELTAKGRRLIEDAFTGHAECLEEAASVLPERERAHLYSGLKKLGLFAAQTNERRKE